MKRIVMPCGGRVCLFRLLVSCIALAVTASAQHFKQVTGTLTQVAAGRAEVFGIGTASQIYRYNPGTKTFVKIPGALAQVAVGGGTLSQKDEVWGVNPAGQIFHFNFGTKTFTQVTGILSQIVVGEGKYDKCHTYEVWGVNASDDIYRYNYCTKQFDQIAGSLSVIATGGGSVWGLTSAGQIFYFTQGVGFDQAEGSLQQIATSGNDVWGLDASGTFYRFESKQTGFVDYGDYEAIQVKVGGDGMWAILPEPEVVSYFNSDSVTYPVSMTQLAVGYGAGVWAIDSSNRVYVFERP